MGFDEFNNPGLILGLGFSSSTELKLKNPTAVKPEQPSAKESNDFEPSLILSLSGEKPYEKATKNNDLILADLYRQDSVASSISHVNVKRERDIEIERVINNNNNSRKVMSGEEEDDDENGGFINARKKLRLTKAQSAMLEESFKHRNSLNPKQKQELAKELNLRPRQVEVWFQNRRARTKLKQTEIDCEFLKKCCETLSEENRKLQKELQELKSLKLENPLFYMQQKLPAAAVCLSCGRRETSKSSLITMAPKHHL